MAERGNGGSVTFTSASADYDNFTRVGVNVAGDMSGPTGSKDSADNVFRLVHIEGNAASGSATLALALLPVDGTKVPKALFRATVAQDSEGLRVGNDGASGDYLYVGTWQHDGSSSSKIDLLTQIPEGYAWYLGCTELDTVTSLEVYWASSRGF